MRWTFDGDVAGAPPARWEFGRTGGGALGRWLVMAEPGAPSGPNVLAQLDADATDARFPVAVVAGVALENLKMSVKCKMVSGAVDQACGVVFRYRDENNYYVTRANALENNVRLYFVKDGKRKQIATWAGKVAAGVWHDLRVEVRAAHIDVFWDHERVIALDDATFSGSGKIGLWTKADSITLFDDLTAEPF